MEKTKNTNYCVLSPKVFLMFCRLSNLQVNRTRIFGSIYNEVLEIAIDNSITISTLNKQKIKCVYVEA